MKSKAKESTVKVSRSIDKHGGLRDGSEDAESIGIHQFVTDTAEVGVSMGMTLNIGNFESVRIDVTCNIPCYKEEIEDAYDCAFKFASDKVQETVAKIRSSNKQSSLI